jgi:hypothetical protein
MSVSWTKDNQKPGAPSSMDVLLRWLLRPGNYARWDSSEAKKTTTAEEIVEEMEAEGIHHRTARCVYFRVHNLKRQYRSVKKWLDDAGQVALFHRGEAGEDVEAAVLRRCPHFRELTPLFDVEEDEDTSSDGEVQDEDEDEDIGAGSSKEEHSGSSGEEDGASRGKGGKSKRKTTRASNSSSRKRGKRGSSRAESLPLSAKQAELEEVSLLLKTYPVIRSLRGSSDDAGPGARNIFLSEEAGKEWTQRLLEVEIEHTRALGECRLEEEKKRAEVRTKLETMLSRNKLKRQGFSNEEVDAVFPL